jgi:hypothetical protein
MSFYSAKKHELVVYKGALCADCKGAFPDCCFQFDHRDPHTKSFTISSKMSRPISEMMIEADKCDLVCANCHAIRTANNPEVGKKISAAKMGKKLSRRHAQSISKSNLGKNAGKIRTPEHIEAIRRNAAKGRLIRWSKPEARSRMSVAMKEAWAAGRKRA